MTKYFPIVIEPEENGAFSAYVPGLPVYAAADTRTHAERSLQETLAAYVQAHPDVIGQSVVKVARVAGSRVDLVGLAAMLGTRRTKAKAQASRANGKLGGRPRTKGMHQSLKAARRSAR